MNAPSQPICRPRLRLDGMTKAFYGVPVVHDVSFGVDAGEVLGLVGENGSGKSTTMNIVAGVLPADRGRMALDGETYTPASRRDADAAGVAFIQQELNVFPNLTVAENLFLCRSPRAIPNLPLISRAKRRERAFELLARVNLVVDPNTPASHLSIGEQQLLEIAAALECDARVMIFDEPTTSLTPRETARLFDLIAQLKTRQVAIIYISHTLEDVLRLSDRIVVMRDGRVVHQTRRTGASAEELVIAMVGRDLQALYPERRPRARAEVPLLRVDGVSEPGLLEDISFVVDPGEIVGISGLMGSGRTELARVLFGLDRHAKGVIQIAGNRLSTGDLRARLKAGMAFVTEDRGVEGLMMDATVLENLALAALPAYAGRGQAVDETRLMRSVTAVAEQLQLKGGASCTAVARTLSGGNQQKIVIGRWLMRNPRLLILDEPTRGVDVGAKAEIYRLLVTLADENGMAVLIISSEFEELIGLCDRILTLRLGRIQAEFDRANFSNSALLRAAFGQGGTA